MDAPEIDFVAGALAHRRKYGGGNSQLVAKAVGIKPKIFPSVLDLTAGLGRDSFVLASLGCEVTLVERNPLVFSLLQEAYTKALRHADEQDPVLLAILRRMTLLHIDGLTYLRQQAPVQQQVIYLDPMFPERRKSAAVKKEMVWLQQQVGDDLDSGLLFESAMNAGVYRVVVKRSKLALPLANSKPSLVFAGTSSRFDVYPIKSLG